MRVPRLEALDSVARQLASFVKTERVAVASEPAYPLQVLLCHLSA
ncbi:hypothetical protein [Caballeronia sordidicola]|uniref:Uncharacterized protein n=1 Tax=Caballeronia sordidicola TaxID=196367 RepID=A0A242MAW4_CABSO|nr:hypothetical protein [Caballeronia sordidicola]OTP68081.1 hypothetical protein PAMC26577_34855 [Caballeronia sordidicola]